LIKELSVKGLDINIVIIDVFEVIYAFWVHMDT